MRFPFRRLPACHSCPCKIALILVIILLAIEIAYLFDFLHKIAKKSRCRSLNRIHSSIEQYPVGIYCVICTITIFQLYIQQNSPRIEEKPLNWINFTYAIQPKLRCPDKFDVALIVHSKVDNFHQRARFRKKYLSKKWVNFQIIRLNYFYQKRIRTLFVVSQNESYHDKLMKEARRFDDILAVSGISEHYHNISHKSRSWITWLNTNCSGSEVILKIDDDVQLNIEGLTHLLNIFDKNKSLILCRLLRSGQVVRNRKSKWFLSKDEYASNSLGTYCQGMAYIISSNLLPTMVENMKKVQYLWVRICFLLKAVNCDCSKFGLITNWQILYSIKRVSKQKLSIFLIQKLTLKMDDWYVTRALMNSTKATYVDIGNHYLNINGQADLDAFHSRNRSTSLSIIFGHFRK